MLPMFPLNMQKQSIMVSFEYSIHVLSVFCVRLPLSTSLSTSKGYLLVCGTQRQNALLMIKSMI